MRKSKENSTPSLDSTFEWIGDEKQRIEQPPLFPDAELMLPQNMPSLKKAIAAIHSVPSTSLGLNGKRLFDAIIMTVQLDFKSRPELTIERIRDERVSPFFDVRVTDLARLAGIPGKNCKRLYAELKELRKTDVTWNVIGEDDSIEMDFEASFLSVLGIGRADGHKKGMIRFAFDPSVLVMLMEPSIWASLSLQTLHTLKTSPAYSLFQNAFKYIGTHKKVTPSFATETWIQLLVGPSRFFKEDKITGEKKINYKDFKRFVLLPALNEINNHPALSYKLELLERRRGNRVAELQFKFELKAQQTLDLPITWDDNLKKALIDIGYAPTEIYELAQRCPIHKVIEAIELLPLQEKRMRDKGIIMRYRKKYFDGILNNIMAVEKVTTETLDEAQKQAEIEVAAERAIRQKEEFEKFQANAFVDAIFLRDDRDELVSMFLASGDGNTLTVQSFAKKGLDKTNRAFWSNFRNWIKRELPQLELELLRFPHERDLNSWISWKLDQAV